MIASFVTLSRLKITIILSLYQLLFKRRVKNKKNMIRKAIVRQSFFQNLKLCTLYIFFWIFPLQKCGAVCHKGHPQNPQNTAIIVAENPEYKIRCENNSFFQVIAVCTRTKGESIEFRSKFIIFEPFFKPLLKDTSPQKVNAVLKWLV